MRYFVTIGDRTLVVDLTGARPTVDGTALDVHLATLPGSPVRHLLADGRSVTLVAEPGDRRGHWTLELAGRRLRAEVVDERTRAIREMTGADADPAERTVVAPMPGLVVRVEVEPGQTVSAGQGLVIVEAMKMENELRAPADGVVARVDVAAGQTVEKGAVLLTLE